MDLLGDAGVRHQLARRRACQERHRGGGGADAVDLALVKPGTTLTGTAARFIVGEALQYCLDHPTTGPVLAGSLTPAAVPAGGGGVVAVTVPPGTSDGAHTVYGVTSPSRSTAAAGILVDGAPRRRYPN